MSVRIRTACRFLLAFAMCAVGSYHFMNPGLFIPMVPPALPSPAALVAISGFFEIAGGVGLLLPPVRRAAGIGLCLLYVAVFPANIYMALYGIRPEGMTGPTWLLWARLPFQLVFIALALWVSRDAGLTEGGGVRDAHRPSGSPSK